MNLCRTSLILTMSCAGLMAEGESVSQLSEQHLSLLRQSIVVWSPIETGAPALLLSPLLTDVDNLRKGYGDLARRAGISVKRSPSKAEIAQVEQLLEEFPAALALFLEKAQLEPGAYTYENQVPGLEDNLGFGFVPVGKPELEKLKTVSFTLTSEHLTLLRNAIWNDLEIDPKRPYGAMTYYAYDMAKILGEPGPQGQRFTPEQEERYRGLHEDLMPALQIFLQKATLP